MVHYSDQLVFLTVDHFIFIKFNSEIDFLHSNQVSVSSIFVVESFEVKYQHLWQFVNSHDFIGHFVVFALVAVPHVVFSESFRQTEILEHIMDRQTINWVVFGFELSDRWVGIKRKVEFGFFLELNFGVKDES